MESHALGTLGHDAKILLRPVVNAVSTAAMNDAHEAAHNQHNLKFCCVQLPPSNPETCHHHLRSNSRVNHPLKSNANNLQTKTICCVGFSAAVATLYATKPMFTVAYIRKNNTHAFLIKTKKH